MSAPKFTPGPWKFSIGGTGDFPTWGVHIGPTLLHLRPGFPMEVMDANARLIAAAPELYAALEGALDCLSSFPGVGSEQARASAEAALAKARGES
jgi:hypothetical protein